MNDQFKKADPDVPLSASMQELQRVSPAFFEAYEELAQAAEAQGALSPKTRSLLMVAGSSSVTNMFAPGVRTHVKAALSHGATHVEVMEVFQLVASLALHSCTFGVPILFDELRKAGITPVEAPGYEGEREKLKEEFIRIRGYWGEFWDQVLLLSPAFFKAYLRFSAVPWKSGQLDTKTKELVYIAIDCNATHLYEQGLRVHIRNALNAGATPIEIMAVFQLMATLGMQTCEIGVPILNGESKALGLPVPGVA